MQKSATWILFIFKILLTKEFEDYLNSPEGIAAMDKLDRKSKRKEGRIDRFNKYIQENDNFDDVMQKIINKYNSIEYKNREWKACREAQTVLYFFMYDYAKKYGRPVVDKELEIVDPSMFTYDVFVIHGYAFELINGQGSFIHVTKIKNTSNVIDEIRTDPEKVNIIFEGEEYQLNEVEYRKLLIKCYTDNIEFKLLDDDNEYLINKDVFKFNKDLPKIFTENDKLAWILFREINKLAWHE